MSIKIAEKPNSRTRSGGTTTLHYIVTGTSDHEAVETALLTTSPTYMDGKPREEELTFEAEWADTITDTGKWDCEVNYTRAGTEGTTVPPETGDSVYNFETGGGTQHITQSLATVRTIPNDGANFKGAIGVSGDGENITVEGVDITASVYNFSETHYLSDSVVTQEYRQKLATLTGKVCADEFRGFAAHEVLFHGASGGKRGEGDWEITFRFAVSRNQAGIKIGDLDTFFKRGWDYLWVRYATKKDVSQYVKVPIQAIVEQVYRDGNFTDLGIGA